MLNLVSRAPHSIVNVIGADAYRVHSGLLTGPFSGFRPESALEYGAIWAADNGCFHPGYNPDAIVSMFRRYQGIPGCQFVVVPDVVCDAGSTLLAFQAWIGTLQRFGYPVALALQNGIEQYRIPWDAIRAVFIGGDDGFKYSDVVRNIVTEAKQREKWVHMGRVNAPERILYCREIGCDSFDGTHFTMVPGDVAKWLPLQMTTPGIARIARQGYRRPEVIREHVQLGLFEVTQLP